MYSREELAQGFRQLGLAPGDVVMAHASVRAVGQVAGGPDQIHLAIGDALTAEGTLMMYASCPVYYDEVGRGHLSAAQEREILEKLPVFDPLTARAARDNGTLVEFFRSYPGTKANAHVARFAVRGRHAEALIATSQPWDYAFGRESALERLVEFHGKLLLLGSDHDAVTFLHYAEHVVDIPDKRISRFKVPVLEGGIRVWRDMAEFDTGNSVHAHWPERFFARLVDTYLARTHNAGGRVGDAEAFLLSAEGLLEFALPMMQAVAADPRAADSLHP